MSATDANGNSKPEAVKSVTAEGGNAGAAANVAAVAPVATRQVPDWLKDNLFVELLKKNYSAFKAIKSYTAKPAQGAGENYATLIGSVKFEVELENEKSKHISYIIKLPIESVMKMMAGQNIFTVESTVYTDVIPELEQLYKAVGVEVKFAPQRYEIETPSEFGVILMEDLSQRGFKNANRLDGFDMEHTKAALKKLAQWHAASAVRVETKGSYSKTVGTGIFTEQFLEMMKGMHEMQMKMYMEFVRTYEGHEVYIDSLIKSQEHAVDDLCDFMQVNSNEFNVLNHGDFWANNIMFQYDAFGKIKETYFVDFQCTRYGSPIYDLYNVLLSSTQYEIKLKYFEYFIKYYHDHLVECLKLLKYPKNLPTLKEIHIAMYKYGNWGFGVASGHMALVLLDPTDTANIDNFMGNTPDALELKKLMYTSQRYRKHAEAVLPWLYNRGAF